MKRKEWLDKEKLKARLHIAEKREKKEKRLRAKQKHDEAAKMRFNQKVERVKAKMAEGHSMLMYHLQEKKQQFPRSLMFRLTKSQNIFHPSVVIPMSFHLQSPNVHQLLHIQCSTQPQQITLEHSGPLRPLRELQPQ